MKQCTSNRTELQTKKNKKNKASNQSCVSHTNISHFITKITFFFVFFTLIVTVYILLVPFSNRKQILRQTFKFTDHQSPTK